MRKPTKIVERMEPKMIAPPPANTFPNSSSGIDAISESIVAMKEDADVRVCSSGSHRLREVVGDCLDDATVLCCCIV